MALDYIGGICVGVCVKFVILNSVENLDFLQINT